MWCIKERGMVWLVLLLCVGGTVSGAWRDDRDPCANSIADAASSAVMPIGPISPISPISPHQPLAECTFGSWSSALGCDVAR
jgi:hypothetical protein